MLGTQHNPFVTGDPNTPGFHVPNLNLANGQATTYPLPSETFNYSYGSDVADFFNSNGAGAVSRAWRFFVDYAPHWSYLLPPRRGRRRRVDDPVDHRAAGEQQGDDDPRDRADAKLILPTKLLE